MATASQIAKVFECTEIKINYLFSEFQFPEIFDSCPMDRLEYKTKDSETLNKVYNLEDIVFHDTTEFKS